MPTRAHRGQRLSVIEGSVPNPFNMPPGCNFAPRCKERFAPCGPHDPDLRAVGGDGEAQVACWLHVDDPPSADAPPATATAGKEGA
jgi:oligopeptide/dipeptide ABC transporter ATP-binding protein